MLEVLAANRDCAGITVPVSDISDAVLRTDDFLQTTLSMRRSVDDAGLVVQLDNRAGHKFPTAYPTRHAWLEVVAIDAAVTTVFHSGGYDDQGRILAGDGSLVPRLSPHYAVVEGDSDVQIYEGVMVGVDGAPTITLLQAAGWWRDNRLLPAGWRADHPEAQRTAPVAVHGYEDFSAGGDRVRYLLPDSAASVSVRLWYQTLPPHTLDAHAADPTPASVRLAEMVEGTPAVPRLVAESEVGIWGTTGVAIRAEVWRTELLRPGRTRGAV
ncbi:MAG: hypothetical protein ACJAYU_003922 [Bradymonadia bacterium]|jgi:hypothetical protein